jgi:hypothetical protein
MAQSATKLALVGRLKSPHRSVLRSFADFAVGTPARPARFFLPDFIIHPPVLLKDGKSIASLDQAADVVRSHAGAAPDDETTSVLHRLQDAATMEFAADAADAFRQWAADKNLKR